MKQDAGRRRSIIAVAVSAVLALVGAVVVLIGVQASDGPPQPATGPSQSRSASAPRGPAGAGMPIAGSTTGPSSRAKNATPPSSRAKNAPANADEADLGPILTPSAPVAIDIPSIGVHTRRFVDLALTAAGNLEVPQDFSAVGWFTSGPSPGQLGPAILAGHVDSHNGPAIFYRLGALRQGAEVRVARKDGSTARFTVDRIQRFPKDHFPDAQVYGAVGRAELRLITCGGSFDEKSGHYVDNVVAFAHLVQ